MDFKRDLLRLTLHRYTRELAGRQELSEASLDRALDAWNIASMSELATLDDADRRAIAQRALDEMRRAAEDLSDYYRLSYFERTTHAIRNLLLEKGVFSEEELDAKMAEIRARFEVDPAGRGSVCAAAQCLPR